MSVDIVSCVSVCLLEKYVVQEGSYNIPDFNVESNTYQNSNTYRKQRDIEYSNISTFVSGGRIAKNKNCERV